LRTTGLLVTTALLLPLVSGCALLTPSPRRTETLTYPDLVHRMMDLERLATLPAPGEQAGQFSSYDRKSVYADGHYVEWDANGDGIGIIREEDGEEVLAEIQGPGCIWRIWSAAPAGGHFKFFLDGETSPTIDLPYAGFFNRENEPFTFPALVYRTPSGQYQGGSNCYVPIPFMKSCRITATKNWGWFYHFSYTRFPPGTRVPKFRRNLSPSGRAALARLDGFLAHRIGTDPAGERLGQTMIERSVSVPAAGGVATVADLTGPGAVTSLKVRVPHMSREEQIDVLRELVLRIAWDRETTPSVWCPLGDFFGTAPGINPYQSLPMGMTEDEFYSYWYMPFATAATVEIINDGDTERSLEVSLIRAPLTRSVESYGRFHAKWHRDALPPKEPEREIDWTLVKTEGRGRFCGALLNVWNPRALWWGEGDEKYFVDGEKFPSTYGTGSEDYLGYAWGQPYFFERPFHNLTLVDASNRFHTSGNRWHIAENIPFQHSFEGCIEKYNANDVPVLYSAVAYWYLSPGGRDPFGPLPLSERIDYYAMPKTHKVPGVLEAEDLPVVEKTGGYPTFHDLSWWAKDKFSGDAARSWTGAKVGDRLTIGFPIDADGDYATSVVLIQAADYAIVQLSLDGEPVGDPVDLYRSFWVLPSDEISLGVHHFTAGQHTLGIEITGHNPEAKPRHFVGIDYIKVQPVNTPEAQDSKMQMKR